LIRSDSIDYLFALNVLAYFTDAEEEQFYGKVQRILKKGGHFIVTHSNELFGLYKLNSCITNFFKKHFESEVISLLSNPNYPQKLTFNIRENPLNYCHKLKYYGLVEKNQRFSLSPFSTITK